MGLYVVIAELLLKRCQNFIDCIKFYISLSTYKPTKPASAATLQLFYHIIHTRKLSLVMSRLWLK